MPAPTRRTLAPAGCTASARPRWCDSSRFLPTRPTTDGRRAEGRAGSRLAVSRPAPDTKGETRADTCKRELRPGKTTCAPRRSACVAHHPGSAAVSRSLSPFEEKCRTGRLSAAAARLPAANPPRGTSALRRRRGRSDRGRPAVRLPGAAATALAVLAPRLLRARGREAPYLGLETLVVPGHRGALHGAPGESLDPAQQVLLARRSEARCAAARLGARRPSDAMHIVLGNVRQIEIDDMPDVRDVDPARGDVGSDQHPRVSRPEAVERAIPLRLGAVPVDDRHLVAGPRQRPREAVGAPFGPGEHEGGKRILLEQRQ